MSGVALIFLALLGLMLIGIQIIVARGWHASLKTEPTDPGTTRRLKRIGLGILGSGVALWVLALAVLQNKLEVALMGGAALFLLSGLWALHVLARAGTINQNKYVVARVILVPITIGLAIAATKVFK